MKMLARDVFEAFLALEVTKQRHAPMPERAKYWLARLGRKLRPEFQELNEQRDDLIKSFDKKNEAGQYWIAPEDQTEFNKKWNEIISTEIEVSGVDRKSISFFLTNSGPAEDGPLSVYELTALEPFVTDEETANSGQVTH